MFRKARLAMTAAMLAGLMATRALSQTPQPPVTTDPAVEGHLRDVSAAIPGATVRTLRGRLASAGVEKVRIEADRGTWFVAGVCDDACGDLDLRLLDSKGEEVMADDADDKFPLTQGAVSGPVTFEVEIIMKACAKDPCAYGVRVYRQ